MASLSSPSRRQPAAAPSRSALKARFTSKASFSSLKQQIAAGIPVPCGYRHRGHVSNPSGGGHWLIVVGVTPSHVIVHDPLEEADLVNGATNGGTARFCRHSRMNYRCAGLRLRAALDGGMPCVSSAAWPLLLLDPRWHHHE
ncbi:MAG: hypothetical protein VKI42_05655 [Synechococcaceae cyanobacterium]|nr:hypothetical protein [Synechococcaceae cyanobacterium]